MSHFNIVLMIPIINGSEMKVLVAIGEDGKKQKAARIKNGKVHLHSPRDNFNET